MIIVRLTLTASTDRFEMKDNKTASISINYQLLYILYIYKANFNGKTL